MRIGVVKLLVSADELVVYLALIDELAHIVRQIRYLINVGALVLKLRECDDLVTVVGDSVRYLTVDVPYNAEQQGAAGHGQKHDDNKENGDNTSFYTHIDLPNITFCQFTT